MHIKPPYKNLLIMDGDYKDENFSGRVKVWLIYNTTTQLLDYVIQIFPETKLQNNVNKTVKNIIFKLINKIACKLIINALRKFGIMVDPTKVEECIKFRWSFKLGDIPILLPGSNNFKHNNRYNPAVPEGYLTRHPPNNSAVSEGYLTRRPPTN